MTAVFTGLSGFPLTPLRDDRIDEAAFVGLLDRLVEARVDSITALGSTGSYAYLRPEERDRIARIAVDHAGDIPVFIGVGALRTTDVLDRVEHAQNVGAAGVLLAPMTYQPLTEHDVVELFREVTEHTDLPVIVYDNPRTTHFTFTTELYARVAELPGIASIKIPGVPTDPDQARAHVSAIRSVVPPQVTIGISGDPAAAAGLNAGSDTWYSVIGGTLPAPAMAITRAAQEGRSADAISESSHLAPLWELFTEFGGSLRVIAVIAEHLGLVHSPCLPRPLQPITGAERRRIIDIAERLDLIRPAEK